jgi:hypothetical protein
VLEPHHLTIFSREQAHMCVGQEHTLVCSVAEPEEEDDEGEGDGEGEGEEDQGHPHTNNNSNNTSSP